MTRAAAVCSILLGLGFGIPGILGARHFATEGTIWRLMGYPTYGEGPFTRWGLPTSTPLLLSFVAVCAAEVLLGLLLLAGSDAAVWVSLLLVPLELFFWVGFALPYAFPVGIAKAVLLVLALAQR